MSNEKDLSKLIERTYQELLGEIRLRDFKLCKRVAYLEKKLGLRTGWDDEDFEIMSEIMRDILVGRQQRSRIINKLVGELKK